MAAYSVEAVEKLRLDFMVFVAAEEMLDIGIKIHVTQWHFSARLALGTSEEDVDVKFQSERGGKLMTTGESEKNPVGESQNRIGRKRPLRSSSPTVNLTLRSPPLHHVPKHLIQTSFKYLQGWRLNHFPGQPVPMLDNPFSHFLSSYHLLLGRRDRPHLSTASFQAVVESDEVSPQPPFLQAEQPQVPQPLPISLVLQTLPQLRCPSLDTLQPLNVSLGVGGPTLNTAFEGHDHCPSPAGHTIPDTSQDAIGFLGRLGTLLAHILVSVNQHPQVLLCQAAFQPLFPKPVALHGVAVAQVYCETVKRKTAPEVAVLVWTISKIDPDGKSATLALYSVSEGDLSSGQHCIPSHSLRSTICKSGIDIPSFDYSERERKHFLRCIKTRGKEAQAKQPQFPQPLPISLVLQTLHQLRCPSLDTLQPLNVSLVVGGPKLNTAFETAFQPLFPKPVALYGIVVTQVQDLALGLVEPHTVGLSPSIQPVQVPLQSLPTLRQINTPAQL
ncbi:hypothetical protein QYF61_027926 [Mycteria americana]|uniref:Uncharacterized protein n=1 Tax=Mycteria americana TaxID=33587 RepID=A0AAN7N0C2_MYCAM|nr:hypothetical protein QYF61_027926 [Mycteria americana]